MNDFEERMLRLNGLEPTPRDRWKCFHRLWRLTHKGCANCLGEMTIPDYFRVFFWGTGWVRLMNSDVDGLGNRRGIPVFLRRRLLAHDRRKRLYGEQLQWLENSKQTAATLRSQYGLEVTPDEVSEVRLKVIQHVREYAARDGVTVPMGDEELYAWVCQAMRNKGEQ